MPIDNNSIIRVESSKNFSLTVFAILCIAGEGAVQANKYDFAQLFFKILHKIVRINVNKSSISINLRPKSKIWLITE